MNSSNMLFDRFRNSLYYLAPEVCTNIRDYFLFVLHIDCKTIKKTNQMTQTPMSERLKILIPALGLKVGTFARAMGVSDTNIRNYLDRGSKPSSEFLEKLVQTFDSINPVWLLTGVGEPMLSKNAAKGDVLLSSTKNNYGNNVGSNKGTVSQHNSPAHGPDDRDTKLALALQEVESLRAQLANKDALIAAQQETIDLLKSAYTRPN